MEGQMTYEEATKILLHRYKVVKDRAAKTGRDFDLEMYDFGVMLSLPCDYCNGITTGIDRKDNTRGYTKDNVTPCCHRCNSMKGANLDYQEMKELGAELEESDYEIDNLI